MPRSLVAQHAPTPHQQFSADCDDSDLAPRFLTATDALKSLPRPGVVPQRSPGNFHQQRTHQAVAVTRDAAGTFGLARVERFRHHANVSTYLTGSLEARHVIEHRYNRFGQSRTNSGNGAQQSDAWISRRQFIKLRMHNQYLLLQFLQLDQLDSQLTAP